MKRIFGIFTPLLLALILVPQSLCARSFNDKLLNRPYADMRPWHLGFSIGMHAQDMTFSHSGFVGSEGQTWFLEQPSYSPGFCVNGLVDIRLNNYFNIRFSPGIYFGNRDVKMIDTTNGTTASQNIKSAYVVAPVDIKFSAVRYRNVRPYLLTGVMPAFDVSKRPTEEYLKLKTSDCYISVGMGCDFYLPYFKFIPEIKFCFGLSDIIEHDRPDLGEEPLKLNVSNSVKRATSKMIVLTFYFE